MSKLYLESMVGDIDFETLPFAWNAFELAAFSSTKALWDYQQSAIENCLKALWKYFDDLSDYQVGEGPEAAANRKEKLFQWYEQNGLDHDLDIPLEQTHKLAGLLREYYPVIDASISYQHFINRACFWMATGSGKTVVLVKLIEILRGLIQRKEIPPHDILVLSSRDDLIEQLRKHVQEFNAAHPDLFINLRELREYAEAKRDNPVLFEDRQLTIFYYRSDNLSDERKERLVDFRDFDNGGRWYVLLDEAHKGNREDSKRQHIYSILSRNGFLFNFSATFTDVRDLTTTVSNFNLSEFIKAGYGKHIAILQQELRAFRQSQDYNNEEKQKIVLKSLLMLTYARKVAAKVRKTNKKLYHEPLLLTLVNSVNTEDADLKLFFNELERIGKGQVRKPAWRSAKEELWEELRSHPPLMFEPNETLRVSEDLFEALTATDVLQAVFNSSSPGEIEVLVRPSNKHELAFKLRTSDRPFALVKIGDISRWLNDKLAGFEIVEGFEDEGFFEALNADSSSINVLMGSRSFYEGWDSNRPNVMNFINIGVGTDARKFILQAIGRGVRIEPVASKRKRLLPLFNANEIDKETFDRLKDNVAPLETLVIFGTNRGALQTVIEHLAQESRTPDFQELSLFLNSAAGEHNLLIPAYRSGQKPMDSSDSARFPIESQEQELLTKYMSYVDDTRVLMAIHDAEPRQITRLKQSVLQPDQFYKSADRAYGNIDLLVRRILYYLDIIPLEFDRLKTLENEINHFKRIEVASGAFEDLTARVSEVAGFKDAAGAKAQLKQQFEQSAIDLDEYTAGIERAAKMVKESRAEYAGRRLMIRYVANHYYIPIILSRETERIDYIKHIIQEPSEVKFLTDLETYASTPDNELHNCDWWMFSKLDEHLDKIGIPYYDGRANKTREFRPDFIFWLQKGERYFIVFVDPKGTAHTDYQRKIDGYATMFENPEGETRVFDHGGKSVVVYAFLHTADRDGLPKRYKEYWFDNVGTLFSSVLSED